MSAFDDYTVEQVEDTITAALNAHDMKAVAALLHVLAVKSPARAEVILAAIRIMGGTK